jgi:hypothetical protein
MRFKLNILNSSSRKACYIIFTLFISISFSLGSALANSCKGGVGCLSCAQLVHLHVPGAEADMQNHGCRPGDNNGTCGVETNQNPDEFRGIASAVRLDNPAYSGIFTDTSDEHGQSHLSGGLLSHFHSRGSVRITPIYLLNHSLLC